MRSTRRPQASNWTSRGGAAHRVQHRGGLGQQLGGQQPLQVLAQDGVGPEGVGEGWRLLEERHRVPLSVRDGSSSFRISNSWAKRLIVTLPIAGSRRSWLISRKRAGW